MMIDLLDALQSAGILKYSIGEPKDTSRIYYNLPGGGRGEYTWTWTALQHPNSGEFIYIRREP